MNFNGKNFYNSPQENKLKSSADYFPQKNQLKGERKLFFIQTATRARRKLNAWKIFPHKLFLYLTKADDFASFFLGMNKQEFFSLLLRHPSSFHPFIHRLTDSLLAGYAMLCHASERE